MKIEIKSLEEVRKHIDRLDSALIYILAERLNFMPAIAEFKDKNNIPLVDEKREKKIIDRLRKIAKKEGLDETFIEEIFLSIINESKRIMINHLKKKKGKKGSLNIFGKMFKK